MPKEISEMVGDDLRVVAANRQVCPTISEITFGNLYSSHKTTPLSWLSVLRLRWDQEPRPRSIRRLRDRPTNLVAADVRRLIPFPLKEVGASSRRLLRKAGCGGRRLASELVSSPNKLYLFPPDSCFPSPSLLNLAPT